MPDLAERSLLALLVAVTLSACGSQAAAPRPDGLKQVILATTTSTQDSGLLDALVPLFEKQGGWQVKTDQFEKQLWQDASLNPKDNSWYVTSGQGMGATLTLADQKDAYT
ncbi:MAG: hypothetical protein ACHQ7M_18290, partial [Chloroflexota bacterium]